MTSISISHDKHTTTTWEFSPTGRRVYVSSNGDGEWVSAVRALQQIAEALSSARSPFPVVTAEV